jgi:6-phosphogluconolactonase
MGIERTGRGSIVYVSNADDGDIGVYHLDTDGGLRISARVPAGKGVMPLAVSQDRRRLYAAIRSEPAAVVTYAIDARSGALEKIAVGRAAASFPYISTDRAGRVLFGASYGSNLIAIHPIEAGGRIGEAVQVIPVGRNAHSIVVDRTNRYAFVPTLGTDQVFQFVFDAGNAQLTANTPPVLQVQPGSGPRHAVFSNDNRFLYVLNELTGTVTVLELDAATGLLTERGFESILPATSTLRPGMPRGAAGTTPTGQAPRNTDNDIWASDLRLRPDGRFLYAAERTGSTLSVLRVDEANGKLEYVASVPTEKQPRGFAIDPAGELLVVAGEKSDTVSAYAIGADGLPRPVGRCAAGKGANWVEIVACE